MIEDVDDKNNMVDELLALFDDDKKLIEDDNSENVIDDEIEETMNNCDIYWDVFSK